MANIRLGLKCLRRANAVAYFHFPNLKDDQKKLCKIDARGRIHKTFFFVTYEWSK